MGEGNGVAYAVGACKQSSCHQCQRRQRRQTVVLLPAGEGEEAQNQNRPEQQNESSFVLASCSGNSLTQDERLLRQRAGQKDGPRHNPDCCEQPEERDGNLAVVVRNAPAKKASDVLVVEIEPGPAAGGWEAEPRR